MRLKTTRPKKKPYRAPRLVVYGDLRRLTTGKKGLNPDSPGQPRTKLPPA